MSWDESDTEAEDSDGDGCDDCSGDLEFSAIVDGGFFTLGKTSCLFPFIPTFPVCLVGVVSSSGGCGCCCLCFFLAFLFRSGFLGFALLLLKSLFFVLLLFFALFMVWELLHIVIKLGSHLVQQLFLC